MNKKKATDILENIYSKKSAFWERKGRETALRIYTSTVKEVAAYRSFLKKESGLIKKGGAWKNFETLPLMSKKNYLTKHPLSTLSKSGIEGEITYSASSGSTGKPFYFPRNSNLEYEYSILLESFLKNLSRSSSTKKRTLVIIGFGMGVWVGGLITYRAFQFVSERGTSLSLITPGVNKKEIFNALRDLSPSYDQTILVGYPPFIKDIVDESCDEGIEIEKLHIKFLFAAEAFTEAFRDYLAKKVGIKNIHNDTLNIYGTADIGAMAFETPTSILLRRLILSNPKISEKIFGKINRTPTLAQYNPYFVHFETIDKEIVLTGDSEIPLVRYAVGDHGGVYTFSELEKKLGQEGIDVYKEAKKHGVHVYELPFVYVYERKDLSTTLYGLQVYPETIREVLLRKDFQTSLTGKFTLITTFDSKKNQRLEIHVEQKRGRIIDKATIKILLEEIVRSLRQHNSEFRELSDFLGKRAYPKIHFWESGNSTYFPVGIKQKWVKK